MKITNLARLMKTGALALLLTGTAHGQTLLVPQLDTAGTVSTYNANTGAVISSPFITGPNGPYDLTHDENYIYVANVNANTIGKYDRFTGAVVSANFVTGLTTPVGIAYHNGQLFVSNFGTGTVALADAATGALITTSLITGLNGPRLLEIHDGNLYVPSSGDGVVGLYATDGTAISPLLITDYAGAFGLAFSDNNLFVTSNVGNTVAEFDAASGLLLDGEFITGLNNPAGIVADGNGHLIVANLQTTIDRYTTGGVLVNANFVPHPGLLAGMDYIAVPEPTTFALLGLGLLGWAVGRRRKTGARG